MAPDRPADPGRWRSSLARLKGGVHCPMSLSSINAACRVIQANDVMDSVHLTQEPHASVTGRFGECGADLRPEVGRLYLT